MNSLIHLVNQEQLNIHLLLDMSNEQMHLKYMNKFIDGSHDKE